MSKEETRKSNFELLKIVSIIMVLILHYFNTNMGGALEEVPSGTINYYAMYFLESLSIIAVNCFVLVTGYFMIGKQHVKLRKAINLLTITSFYGLLFYIVNAVVQVYLGSYTGIGLKGLASAIVPLHGSKWFVGSYVVLYLLSPFVNMVLNQLSKGKFEQLLFIVIISFSIVPTVLPIVSFNDKGYGVLSFIMFYSVGAYIRLHFTGKVSKWLYLSVYILSATCTFVLGLKLGMGSFVWNYNTVFNLVGAVSLFQFFSNLSFKSKAVNYLATFTFPIYIIHTDFSLRDMIFRKVLQTQNYWNSNGFLLHMLVSVVLLFLSCVVIEIGRRYLTKSADKFLNIEIIDRVRIGDQNFSPEIFEVK